MSNILRNIPSVNELLESAPLKALSEQANRNVVVAGVRDFLDDLRKEVQDKAKEMNLPNPAELAERIADWIKQDEIPLLRPVVNATGILLHTGLGRAPLAEEAIHAVQEVSDGYASLEVDLASGERSQRVKCVQKLLQQLTGAEAALVVNNNAGATLLTLSALANGKEVVVSRGQLIEIGGSYRLPDVMSQSGAKLHEVGTTNKTRIGDYQQAIHSDTAAVMKVHPSNYVVVGFSEQPTLQQLVDLGHRRNVHVIDDVGSGALIDYGKYGITDEPIVSESIKAGADVVLFSGDKLLGGPQAGIIVGKRELIDRITKHPLTRAFRVDKMTLAALAATLRIYRDQDSVEQKIPLLSLLSTSVENLQNRAERIAPQIATCPVVAAVEVTEDVSYLGGGSVPSQQLPTRCLAITPAGQSVDQLSAALRAGSPSVFGRVKRDSLLIDLRTVFPRQDMQIVAALKALSGLENEASEAPPPLETLDESDIAD